MFQHINIRTRLTTMPSDACYVHRYNAMPSNPKTEPQEKSIHAIEYHKKENVLI